MSASTVAIVGSSAVRGSRTIPSEDVDRAFGMPIGKLRQRAGIESLAYASQDEDEITLGTVAGSSALRDASIDGKEIGWLIASSETHRAYPSLATELHATLSLPDDCAALDIGGACLGFVNALAIAKSLLSTGPAASALIITADMHSRTLTPQRVAGEFGGLFGDGAAAFVLRSVPQPPLPSVFVLGDFFFGCASQYAHAIRIKGGEQGPLDLEFDGDALSRAAITRLDAVIGEIERRSGVSRSEVLAFATHQPNPRLLGLIARQCRIPMNKFPAVARTAGNLGSSTCASALHQTLAAARSGGQRSSSPVFIASLGPGLVYGGGWLR